MFAREEKTMTDRMLVLLKRKDSTHPSLALTIDRMDLLSITQHNNIPTPNYIEKGP